MLIGACFPDQVRICPHVFLSLLFLNCPQQPLFCLDLLNRHAFIKMESFKPDQTSGILESSYDSEQVVEIITRFNELIALKSEVIRKNKPGQAEGNGAMLDTFKSSQGVKMSNLNLSHICFSTDSRTT